VLGRNSGLEDYFGWIAGNFDASISWDDLAWVRQRWPGPLILKGILDPDDAREALARGVDGIVVSNHGGRQLDGALSTARALPAIANAVGGKLPILVDGGVRSGLDVVRMLALGANFVLLGRAWVYALAGGGGAGVAHALKLIEAEMRVAMALTGVTRVSEINESLLAK
jgi:L-lactate dehydrogenase (cytochrome)